MRQVSLKIILLVLLLFIGCAEKVELDKHGDRYYNPKEWPKFYTGQYTFYHENGQKSSEGNFKDGKEDSTWFFYDTNGQIKRKGNFKDGKEDSTWFFYDPYGKIRRKYDYKDGIIFVTDIDGNTYKAVRIGDRVWFTENLKTTHYKNGETIPNITAHDEWENDKTGAYSDYRERGEPMNNPTYSNTYGHLYNWYAVSNPNGLCPDGWHVPHENEFLYLGEFVGGDTGKLKEQGNEHWKIFDLWGLLEATNESGFTALPGGRRGMWFTDSYQGYSQINGEGDFWTSSGAQNDRAFFFEMTYVSHSLYKKNMPKWSGFSVRCVGD